MLAVLWRGIRSSVLREQRLPLALTVGPQKGEGRRLVVLVVDTGARERLDERIKHGDPVAHSSHLLISTVKWVSARSQSPSSVATLPVPMA